MMTDIYLFNENSRASIYGIGTYLKQVTNCLQNIKNIRLHLVELKSSVQHFTIEEKEIRTFRIPNVYEKGQPKERYYRNAYYLLAPYINKNKNKLSFHLNYTQEYPLIEYFKKVYPRCQIYYTIHYLSWCFVLKGNTSYFRRIVQSSHPELLPAKEKQVYDSYLEEQRLFNAVDKVICLAQYTKELLIRDYLLSKEKIELIYNGLEIIKNSPSLLEKERIRNKLFLHAEDKIILFVGRLDEIKGITILIKAFKLIQKEIPNSHLIIVGDGDFADKMKESEFCWTKITFTGRLDREQLYQFYKIADLGVMLSTHEQCSYVAIEMLAHGVPLIVSTSTGLNEVIDDDRLKVQVRELENDVVISENECAEKMVFVLKGSFTKQISEDNRKKYIKFYQHKDMKSKMLHIYTSHHQSTQRSPLLG